MDQSLRFAHINYFQYYNASSHYQPLYFSSYLHLRSVSHFKQHSSDNHKKASTLFTPLNTSNFLTVKSTNSVKYLILGGILEPHNLRSLEKKYDYYDI